jgi:flagellar motility protein MotE (MotC chaperone)
MKWVSEDEYERMAAAIATVKNATAELERRNERIATLERELARQREQHAHERETWAAAMGMERAEVSKLVKVCEASATVIAQQAVTIDRQSKLIERLAEKHAPIEGADTGSTLLDDALALHADPKSRRSTEAF